MANPFLQVSREAQDALTEFSQQFDAALAVAEPDSIWARELGLYETSKAIKTTYPLPVSAAGYRERTGDDRMRSLFLKSVSLQHKEWEDGVAEKAMIVEAPDFIGWGKEPANIAREGMRQPNLIVVDEVLEANPTLEFDGKALFANDHPVNVFDDSFGTFDNLQATDDTSIDNGDFLKEVLQRFRARKGPNGRVMGLRCTHLLVPAAREQQFKDLLENDQLIKAISGGSFGAVNNRLKGIVQLVVADELTDDDAIYPLDGVKGCYPWIVQDGGAPEEIVYDKDSDLYKDSGIIGVKYVLRMGTAAALPHAIEKVVIS